jgi:hypothetical protein
MLKKVLTSFIILFSIIVANAQVGDWIAANPGLGIDVAVDAFNDSYTCGQIVGANNQIGTSVITSNGLQDVVVQKYWPRTVNISAMAMRTHHSKESRKTKIPRKKNLIQTIILNAYSN